MSIHAEDAPAGHEHHAGERSVPELEVDQTVAPRPEEEIADALRAEPDRQDHSEHPE